MRSVLDGIGITGLGLDAPVEQLSGGERRRTALAAALVRGPEATAPTSSMVPHCWHSPQRPTHLAVVQPHSRQR